MFLSLALILLIGLFLGFLSKKLRLPALIGMILAGMAIGPYGFDLIDQQMLNLSIDIRKMALIVILIRAGLKLDFSDLQKTGSSAIKMSFLPAVFELVAVILLAPILLNISRIHGAILGAVLAAVSPAVIVPRMIELIEKNIGTEKGIPQLILVGSSMDDVFVIILFNVFITLIQGSDFSLISIAQMPISIVLGIAIGLIMGGLIYIVESLMQMDQVVGAMVILAAAFGLTSLEEALRGIVPIASLVSVMSMGMMIRRLNPDFSRKTAHVFNALWAPAEIFLFVLVGASVNFLTLGNLGLKVVFLIVSALFFRSMGVLLSLQGANFTWREKVFCVFSYFPKATVQAAIGGLPLAMGIEHGELILTASVAAILLTAPLGAFLIDAGSEQLLASTDS